MSKATKSSVKNKSPMKNLYCSACNKLFKNINSFENHENSKKHKENVANMAMDDDIDISDFEDGGRQESMTKNDEQINGQTEEGDGDGMGNSTSDIEDNDIRETLSDDSDKIQVIYLKYIGDYILI